jgi:hypothetical protein
MATGPNYRPNIQLPNLMGNTGDPYNLNLYPQDMIFEKPAGWDDTKGVIDTSNPQVMHAGFSWPFGGTNEYATTRPSGIDTLMNYQDPIRSLPGGNYQNWQDRIMNTQLQDLRDYENSLADINTNPLYDDTEIYMKEPGEKLFAENWTLSDLLNPLRKGDENIFGYQKRPGQDFNFGLGNLFQRNPQMEAAIDEIQETGSFGGQKYILDEDRNKIYSEVNPFGKNLRSWDGSTDPKAMDDKTLAWAMDRLAKGKAISQRLRNILQNRGMLTPTGTDRIGGDPSIPIGPIDTGGYTGPATRDFDPGIAARTTHWSERPDRSGSPSRGFVNPGAGSYGPWKAEGGRIGYANGELVDEDINIAGPGFDVNENVMMASAPDPMDALNDFALEIFGKPLDMLNEEERGILYDLANEQAAIGEEQGIASLV